MTEKEQKIIINWETNRKSGKWKYVFKVGGIFALILLVVGNLIDYGLGNFPDNFFTLNNILSEIIGKTVGGLVFGFLMWYLQESTYKSLLKKKENESNG